MALTEIGMAGKEEIGMSYFTESECLSTSSNQEPVNEKPLFISQEIFSFVETFRQPLAFYYQVISGGQTNSFSSFSSLKNSLFSNIVELSKKKISYQEEKTSVCFEDENNIDGFSQQIFSAAEDPKRDCGKRCGTPNNRKSCSGNCNQCVCSGQTCICG